MRLKQGLHLALIVVILDQVSKLWILEWLMQPPRPIRLADFLAIVLVWNRGMSFGLFNTASPLVPWILAAFSTAVVAALTWWLARAERLLLTIALGFVIGGAVGNLIDRFIYGAVVDFVLFHYGEWQWPAFNLADSAITVGVILLLFDSLFGPKESPK
jgi:signal peptidase II